MFGDINASVFRCVAECFWRVSDLVYGDMSGSVFRCVADCFGVSVNECLEI